MTAMTGTPILIPTLCAATHCCDALRCPSSAFSFPPIALLLQQMLRLLQFILPAGRQTFPRSVDVELHHANGRTQALRADLFGSHDTSDRFRVLLIESRRRIRRNSFDLPAPISITPLVMRFCLSRRCFPRSAIGFRFGHRSSPLSLLLYCHTSYASSKARAHFPPAIRPPRTCPQENFAPCR
jgi:hypothetical protein